VSRYADLKATSKQLERENSDLKELFTCLSSRPEPEALEVYRKLRTTDDPFSTLQYAKDAGLVPATSSSDSCSITDDVLARINDEALAASVLKVPARPWTSVAGDGLVSHLLSTFFKWDDPLAYSFIDRKLFLRDLRHGNHSPRPFCSPLLVNSLCALRSVSLCPIRIPLFLPPAHLT
jgi:hypothetical protein